MLELGEKISTSGGWCTIFAVKNDPGKCAKVVAFARRHETGLPCPATEAKNKYGIDDLLQYELDNYRRILAVTPDDLKENLVKIHGIEPIGNGKYALVMNLVADASGKPAPNLDMNQCPLHADFFIRLERLRREVFDRHAIDYFGIAGRNILVRDAKTPVLVDFAKDRAWFRAQFWLRLPFFVRLKLKRYFQTVYASQQQPD